MGTEVDVVVMDAAALMHMALLCAAVAATALLEEVVTDPVVVVAAVLLLHLAAVLDMALVCGEDEAPLVARTQMQDPMIGVHRLPNLTERMERPVDDHQMAIAPTQATALCLTSMLAMKRIIPIATQTSLEQNHHHPSTTTTPYSLVTLQPRMREQVQTRGTTRSCETMIRMLLGWSGCSKAAAQRGLIPSPAKVASIALMSEY
jgi:hypothetical protein